MKTERYTGRIPSDIQVTQFQDKKNKKNKPKSQRLLANYQRQGKISFIDFKSTMALLTTLILDLMPPDCETINFCSFKP